MQHGAQRRRGGDCGSGSEKLAKRPATTTLLIATHFVDHAPTSILTQGNISDQIEQK